MSSNGHPFTRSTIDPDTAAAPQLLRLGDLLSAWQSEAEALHEAKTTGAQLGPITGFAKLDRELGYCLAPGLHVVHGQPGVGKSAFVLQLASGCGCPALFVTCEMSPLELFRRIAARVTQTFLGRFKTGELTPEASLAMARRAAAAVPELAIADGTQAFASPEWLRAAARAVRGSRQHLLIVVDSVHSWTEGVALDVPEYERLNSGLATLRKLSHELGCAIVGVAERNRANMSTGGLSAGAGTRKLEYGAETVLDLAQAADVVPNSAGEVEVSVIIAKNRHGAPGRKIHLKFRGALQQFSEV